MSYRILRMAYWSYIIRFSSILDSALLVCRKKFDHLDFVHVQMHVLCASYTWVQARFAASDPMFMLLESTTLCVTRYFLTVHTFKRSYL